MDNDIKEIIENVISKKKMNHYLRAGFYYLMPFATQRFPVKSLLTNMLYLFRWGYRRGKGELINKLGNPGGKKYRDIAPSAYRVAEKLSGFKLNGYDSNAKLDILADLLLASLFENKNLSHNRHEIILRMIASHYFSSWVDLPIWSSNLRGVPELIVSILSEQKDGYYLNAEPIKKDRYNISCAFYKNALLSFFGRGTIRGELFNLSGDSFDESSDVGIDQLLSIRIAEYLGSAPLFDKGEKRIRNIYPVARKETQIFREDFTIFIDQYLDRIPRKTLLPMLESCISIGISNIYTALIRQAIDWSKLHKICSHEPFQLFVDCSGSTEREIRNCSENSVDAVFELIPDLTIVVMVMRILDMYVIEKGIEYKGDKLPDPRTYLNMLGSIIDQQSAHYTKAYSDLEGDCNLLAYAFRERGYRHIADILSDTGVHPAYRLARMIVLAMGKHAGYDKYAEFLNSAMMTNEYNGILKERKTTINGRTSKRRSIVLSSTALEYLVHRHIAGQERTLSLRQFIEILKSRYGFYIDEAPSGYNFSFDILKENRNFFERHLRDLGLFSGVNDSESMKSLKSRFN